MRSRGFVGVFLLAACATPTPTETPPIPLAPPRRAPVVALEKPESAPPILVAVFDVDAGPKLGLGVGARLTDLLVAELGAEDRLRVVSRAELRARLAKDKKASFRGCAADRCRLELARSVAAARVVVAEVRRSAGRCVLAARWLDVESGRGGGASIRARCVEPALADAVRRLVAELVRPPFTPR